MEQFFTIKPIARIYTDFQERFGIPRQSGLADELTGRIVFEKEFQNPDAVNGLEGFDYLWLIWNFSRTRIDMEQTPVRWAPLVAPPRLGGQIKKGVFASRSPYRPNSLGLSCVKLLSVDISLNDGPVLYVGGADILNGTEIFDIKPYLPYADSHPEAAGGFSVSTRKVLKIDFPAELLEKVPREKQSALLQVLEQDPRGAYEKQPGYVYGLSFASFDIRFTIEDDVLKVFEVVALETGDTVFSRIK